MTVIYLFPHGGAGASSYRSYAAAFPREVGRVVPVEIPGRGKRSHEPFAASISGCASLMLQQIDATGEDFVFHGHCMGALLAFEAIKSIQAGGGELPLYLMVSGRNAPGHMNEWLSRVPDLDDRALFETLRDIGGVSSGLSFAMAKPFLDVLRKDQAMSRDYDPGAARIDVPILALAGRDDRMTSASELADWKSYTSKSVSVEWLDGQHYFPLDQPSRVALHVQRFGEFRDQP